MPTGKTEHELVKADRQALRAEIYAWIFYGVLMVPASGVIAYVAERAYGPVAAVLCWSAFWLGVIHNIKRKARSSR